MHLITSMLDRTRLLRTNVTLLQDTYLTYTVMRQPAWLVLCVCVCGTIGVQTHECVYMRERPEVNIQGCIHYFSVAWGKMPWPKENAWKKLLIWSHTFRGIRVHRGGSPWQQAEGSHLSQSMKQKRTNWK